MSNRDPITDPRGGDVWIKEPGDWTWLNRYKGQNEFYVKSIIKEGYTPAVVIPLELAQRLMLELEAGYDGCDMTRDLAAYMPKGEK